MHARKPARFGRFRELLIGRNCAVSQPLIELPDGLYTLPGVWLDAGGHQLRFWLTSPASWRIDLAWSISSGRNWKPYSSSSASIRFRCLTESHVPMVSG